MKNLKQDIKSGIIIFLTIISLGAITVFAANWYDSLTSNPGDPLTATKWNNLAKTTVPTGAIMAFNLSACPDTWTEYLPARGRFLRGIDSTGVNDSIRVLGDLQTDAFQGHFHASSFSIDNTGLPNIYPYWSNGYSATAENLVGRGTAGAVPDDTNGTPRTAAETRPKNVAVLYCVKQ